MKEAAARANLETGRHVYDLVCERSPMTRDELERLPDPEAMTAPKGNSRNGWLRVSLYVPQPENKPRVSHPANVIRSQLDENRVSFA